MTKRTVFELKRCVKSKLQISLEEDGWQHLGEHSKNKDWREVYGVLYEHVRCEKPYDCFGEPLDEKLKVDVYVKGFRTEALRAG